jgi:tetratricopeptide (TPR) repeat protein
VDDYLVARLTSRIKDGDSLWGSTRNYLEHLPANVEDAAYRCFIVHWFNPDVLAALVADDESIAPGQSVPLQGEDVQAVYERLLSLPFVEAYPGRGVSVHDLTRQSALEHLWRDRLEFYREVSRKAEAYFGSRVASTTEQDPGELAEWIYHLLIVDEEQAISEVESLLDYFASRREVGPCHALVQMAEEHAAGQRLSPATLPIVKYWRAREAELTSDAQQVASIFAELVSAADDAVPDWIKAATAMILGRCLHGTGQYAQAFEAFQDARARYERLGLPEALASALKSLGNVCTAREQYTQAEDFLHEALRVYVNEAVIPITNDAEDSSAIHANGATKPVAPPSQMYEPLAWHGPVEISESDADDADTDDGLESTSGNEEAREPIPLDIHIYGLELERDGATDADLEDSIPILLVEVTVTLADIWLALGTLFQSKDDFDRAVAHLRLAEEMYLELGDGYGLQRAAHALHFLGASRGDVGYATIKVGVQRELLEFARSRDDRILELEVLLSLAAVQENDVAERSQAKEHYSAAQALAHAMHDAVSEAIALGGLASLDWTAQNYEGAQARYDQALQLYRTIGYGQGEVGIELALADLALARFDPHSSVDHFRNAERIAADLGVPTYQVDALRGLGRLARDRTRYQEAVTYFQQAAKIARRAHNQLSEMQSLSDLADAYFMRAELDKARATYQRALAIARKLRRPADEASIQVGLGYIASRQRSYEEASQAFERARGIYSQLKQPNGEWAVLYGLANMHSDHDDMEARVETLEEALAVAQQLEDPALLLETESELGAAYTYAGRHEQAITLLEEVVRRDPRNPAAVGRLGDALLQAGNYERSLAESQRAYKMDEQQIWVLRNIGHALLGLGRADEAEQTYRKAMASHPDGDDLNSSIKDIVGILHRQPDIARGKEFLALFESAQADLDAGKKPTT